jgi:hypothetical protein
MTLHRTVFLSIFAVIVALASTPARSAEPADAAEMRSVALAFTKTVHADDLAAARNHAVGSDKSFQTLAIVSEVWKLMDEVFVAMHKAAPESDERAAQMKLMMGLTEDAETQVARAVITVDGDTATLSDPPPPPKPAPVTRPGGRPALRDKIDLEPGGEPVILRKVAGKWKVDLDATLVAKGLNTEKGIAFWKGIGDESKKMLEAIKSGTFPTDRGAATRPAVR